MPAFLSEPECKHFTVTKIAQGVFAAIDKDRQTGSNAGIVDLGNTSVVFDIFVNIDAADELRRMCHKLTGREPAYIINSHAHADHFAGNCRFSEGAAVIASNPVAEQIGKTKEEFGKERSEYRAEIEKIETALPGSSDGLEIAGMKNSLFFLKNLSKPGVEIRTPDIAFENELTISGVGTCMLLKEFPLAHSPGDVIAWLPEAGVCFTGDLLFKDTHPWLGRGDPEQLLNALDFVLTLGARLLVPGHGGLACNEDVLQEMKYIREMLALVMSKGKLDEKDYSPEELTPEFRQWESLFFYRNIKFLINRIKA